MSTQDISKMAEESPLQKMLSKYNKYIANLEWHIKTNQPWDADIVLKRISDFKEVVADIKTTAALTSPASGWVKVSGNFPDNPNEKVFKHKHSGQYIVTEDFEDEYLLDVYGKEHYYHDLLWLDENILR